MNALRYTGAVRCVVVLWLVLVGTALLYGCATPVQQLGQTATAPAMPTSTAVAGVAGTPTPTATPAVISATAQEILNLGCVCHVQREEGAPSTADMAQRSPVAIRQAVRQGPGQMPAWNTENLSEEWLTAIIDHIKSSSH